MIGSLRWKLTAFNTAVTGFILLAMTCLSLFVSERDTRARTFQNFESYMSTVTTHLVSQNRLSVEWLKLVEWAGNMTISIQDGEQPLFSMGLSDGLPRDIVQQVRQQAGEEFSVYGDGSRGSGSCAFTMENGYIGGLAVIEKENSPLEVIFLYSLAEMERGILRQRLVVWLGELLALLLLWVFSWHFTGRMLRPIQENQQRQAQFTAAASHELRTPLAAILSAASAMEGAGPGEQAYFLGHIQREGQRMSRLIGDMLTLSTGDSRNWQMQWSGVEPDMLLLDVYERYLPLAKERGLTLSVSLPQEDIPAVQADRERLLQALSILLDNALAYTPAPGRIQLALEKRKNKVRMTVSDSGPGVPDGEKAHIFERFHRGGKSHGGGSHFGLGLSIAAQIVSLHRGNIWVEDGDDCGAEFILELPDRLDPT